MSRRSFEKYGIGILVVGIMLIFLFKGIGVLFELIMEKASSLKTFIYNLCIEHTIGVLVFVALCLIIFLKIVINNHKIRVTTQQEYKRKEDEWIQRQEEERLKQEEETKRRQEEELLKQEETKRIEEKKAKERQLRKAARERERQKQLQKRIEEQKKAEEKRREELKKFEDKLREEEKKRLEREYKYGYKDEMTGYEYEQYCADLFNYFSWNAQTTKKSGDYWGDVIAEKNGIKIIAQCKNGKEKWGLML